MPNQHTKPLEVILQERIGMPVKDYLIECLNKGLTLNEVMEQAEISQPFLYKLRKKYGVDDTFSKARRRVNRPQNIREVLNDPSLNRKTILCRKWV